MAAPHSVSSAAGCEPAPPGVANPSPPAPAQAAPSPSPSAIPPSSPRTPAAPAKEPPSAGRPSMGSRQEYLDSLKPPSREEFERLAAVQERREKKPRRRAHEPNGEVVHPERQSVEEGRDRMEPPREGRPDCPGRRQGPRGAHGERQAREKAAEVMQHSYRRATATQGLGLDASTRWTQAIRDARWRDVNTPRAREDTQGRADDERDGAAAGSSSSGQCRRRSSASTTARNNWRKAAMVARRAGAGEDSPGSDDEAETPSDHAEALPEGMAAGPEAAMQGRRRSDASRSRRRKQTKTLSLQYFLEMVDLKHRYGANLRVYHEAWLEQADTRENFFWWLDHGAGRHRSLAACPRGRLEREQVRYLSREERQYYLVRVDGEGRLCWAKNGARIDTTQPMRDSIRGIVPIDDPTPAFAPRTDGGGGGGGGGPPSAPPSEPELEAARAAKYADPAFDNARGLGKLRHVSTATVFNKLLRKSVRRNTWIFVSDRRHRLYVSIKASGAFQHSSFLQGAPIAAAGAIRVRDGRLAALSPLSGHYRPPAQHFRAFVHSLHDQGVDTSHLSIANSYAVLRALEAYVAVRDRARRVLRPARAAAPPPPQPRARSDGANGRRPRAKIARWSGFRPKRTARDGGGRLAAVS